MGLYAIKIYNLQRTEKRPKQQLFGSFKNLGSVNTDIFAYSTTYQDWTN